MKTPIVTNDKPIDTISSPSDNNLNMAGNGLIGERFATHAEFVERHVAFDKQIVDYLHRDRRNGQKLDGNTRARIGRDAALFMNGINAWSRIKFAEIVVRRFEAIATSLPAGTSMDMVTIAPGQFSTTLTDAPSFDIELLKKFVRLNMRGFHYFGIVEAGFYPNRTIEAGRRQPTVSWHVHLLVWNCDRGDLLKRRDLINDRHDSLFPQLKAAHVSKVNPQRYGSRIRYFLKGPIVQYKEWTRSAEHIDSDTGEIFSSSFEQRKDDIRSGNAIKLIRALSDFPLDDLALAGGAGIEFLDDVLTEALAPMRSREHWARLTQGTRPTLQVKPTIVR